MTAAPSGTVRSLVHGRGGEDALVTVEGDVLDHAALGREVDRLSAALAHAGIGPNDRVAIVLPNGPEMALTLLAVMSVACAAPLNPKYTSDELDFYLEDLRPKALVTFDDASPAVRSAAVATSVSTAVRAAGATPVVRVGGSGLHIDFMTGGATDCVADRTVAGDGPAGAAPTGVRPSGDDHALVLHTSGTTSRPKIVPLLQRHLATSARNIASALGLAPGDRSLDVMPLFHVHGIMGSMLAPLSAGGAVIATPGFDAFKFARWLDELRPTYYSAVPTMHQLVLTRARPAKPTTLRFVRSSSSALPRAVYDELHERFGVPVIECYGMTEASHQMTANPLPPGVAKPGSVGLPAGIDVGVVDDDAHVLPPRHRGQVVIRGETVIDGYENDADANAAGFFDGWFRTGDEGFLDEDGYLFLTGRIKEQINRGGEKISPLEVEDVLLGHPAVREAVVFAIPDDRLGEDVGAVVVLAEGAATDEAELRQHVRKRLAAFKVPRTIVLADEIPKGATGKLQRIGLAQKLGLAAGR